MKNKTLVALFWLLSAFAAFAQQALWKVDQSSGYPYKMQFNLGVDWKTAFSIASTGDLIDGAARSPLIGYLYGNGPGANTTSSTTIPAPDVLYTPPGTGAIPVDLTDILLHYNAPELYGASGSREATTCSIAAGTNTATCADVSTFKVGHGINIVGAGAAFAGGVPTNVAETIAGATGSTERRYNVKCIDVNGGIGASATQLVVSNSFATLDYNTNYIYLAWDAPAQSCAGYAVYGGSAGTGALLTVTSKTFTTDYGVKTLVESPIVPAASSTVHAGSWVRKITAINGNDLTLDGTATTTVTDAVASHDDTEAVKSAVAYCALRKECKLSVPGRYNLSSNIHIPQPVIMEGTGQRGRRYQNRTTPAPADTLDDNALSQFRWIGPPDGTMLTYGDDGSGGQNGGIAGGHLSDFAVDGLGVAKFDLRLADVQFCSLERLYMIGATDAQMRLRPSGLTQIQMACDFHTLNISTWDRNNVLADGIRVDGEAIAGSTLTNHRFYNLWVRHQNGHGVHWPAGVKAGAADQFLFDWPHIQRSTTQTGWGLFVETDYNGTPGDPNDPPSIAEGIHVNGGIIVGKICIMKPNIFEGSTFLGFDTANMAAADAKAPFACPGASELYATTDRGSRFGYARYPTGLNNTSITDTMAFRALAGGLLTTDHVWTVTASDGGTVAAGFSRFGTDLLSTATLNSSAAISFPSNNYGVELSRTPSTVWSVHESTNSDQLAWWGHANDASGTPTDALLVVQDTAQTNYRCLGRVASVDTYVDTGISRAFTRGRWRIEMKPALFGITARADIYFGYMDAGGFNSESWTRVCSFAAADFPSTPMMTVARVQTTTTAQKAITINGFQQVQTLFKW